MTRSIDKATGELDARPVTVVVSEWLNIPLPEEESQQDLYRCLNMVSPGPHVLLLVLQIGNFTQEDENSLEVIKKYLGQKSEEFIFTIFTRGDELSEPFESYIEQCGGFIKQHIERCKGRYLVFNNKEESDQSQVRDLLMKMESMVKENRGYYSTDILDNTEEFIQLRLRKTLKEKEEMKRERDNLRKKHEEQQNRSRKLEREIQDCKIQLKEKDECISKQRQERQREQEERERRWKKQEEARKIELKRQREDHEKTVQFERHQNETAEKKLESYRREMKRDREKWDKEKNELWERISEEKKKSLEEEKTRHRKVQEEFSKKGKKRTIGVIILSALLFVVLYHFFSSYFTNAT